MNKRLAVLVVGLCAFLAGAFVTTQMPQVFGQEAKGPKWSHALELRVRKAGEADFTKDTKKWSIEVFKDENNGNWIYITESGSIAVVKP